jgi:CheY-like chemotaxis protein
LESANQVEHLMNPLPHDNMVNVLVVDDDEGIRETMGDILKEMGAHVMLASDGYIALEITKKEPVDLIMMDMRMPGPKIRIILVTAYATEETFAAARHAGIQEVMYKPLDLGKLAAMIKK